MKDTAMGIYPATERTLRRFAGFEVVNIIDGCKQFPDAKIICFTSEYKHTMIDMIIKNNGTIYVSDIYGETMDRKEIFYLENT